MKLGISEHFRLFRLLLKGVASLKNCPEKQIVLALWLPKLRQTVTNRPILSSTQSNVDAKYTKGVYVVAGAAVT